MRCFDAIRTDPRLAALAERLTSAPGPAVAGGLWGSCAPILATYLAQRLHRPLLLVTPHVDEADDLRDDIETAAGVTPELLPALESLGGPDPDDDELWSERLRVSVKIDQAAREPQPGAARTLIVAAIHALMQPVPSPTAIAQASLRIATGQTLSPEAVCEWLEREGFTHCDQVELPGDCARRGGIVDIFSHAHDEPVRIEFFGDQVESIRLFTPDTQRSSSALGAVQIPAARAVRPGRGSAKGRADSETTSFLALLPADTLVAFCEPVEIQELGRTYWQRLGERAGLIPADAIFRKSAGLTQLYLQRFAGGEPEAVDFGVTSLPPFEARQSDALLALAELANEADVIVLCDNEPEQRRFAEVLEEGTKGRRDEGAEGPRGQGTKGAGEQGNQDTKRAEAEGADERAGQEAELAARAWHAAALRMVRSVVGVLHRGFRWTPADRAERPIAFVPHHELFGRYRQRRTLRRVAPARPIDTFFDLKPGDAVVHVLHGIGRFVGLTTLEREGRREEYLAIEFADRAVVYVAASQIHLVQKYIGSAKGRPRLSKLGGAAWKRSKERVAEAVTDLAAELLALQARRATQPGIAFPHDTSWQQEFEGSFLYEETPDQLRALDEIKLDMTRPRPMDRLVCGDVGFGKTELAIRAAFKAIEYGKQVAVLVPTTVLAEQHHQTFCDRLADYPFTVEVISRFRTRREQTRILEAARKGQLDLLIGTHRLLSGDVHFADLGLLVIDEEQRFGVEAKERLKQLRATVDILTLSATPIPRTLHMSLLGIRDISMLASPPLDRRAIVTSVRMWDDELIREAIVRELSREGQVYFVHNFVRDIHSISAKLQALVPDARIVVGHGQMGGPELEDVMLKFLRREADVLVSTNIIESGIDIASANTIFINRADRFGLADLHQLRGRVGRSRHRAYCYLLLSPKHPVLETAARRLKAIEQYSELGAGFQIAMRDLEIRGAGNILGPEQSGHIELVGYEMYCQLLEQAVRKLKDEPADPWRPVSLDLGMSASIPTRYVSSERQRMEVYRRLALCRSSADVETLRSDLRDGFGPIPEAVETLLQLAEIRALAQPWGIRSIVLKPPDLVFAINDLQRVRALFAQGPGSPRVPDGNTIHWRLGARYLEPATMLAVLRKQLAAAPADATAGRCPAAATT